MKNSYYRLNKELALMLKGGVIMDVPSESPLNAMVNAFLTSSLI